MIKDTTRQKKSNKSAIKIWHIVDIRILFLKTNKEALNENNNDNHVLMINDIYFMRKLKIYSIDIKILIRI